MIPKISICIICIGTEADLHNSLSGICKYDAEIIVVNGLIKNQISQEHPADSPLLSIAEEANPAKALYDAVKKATGEWILILRAGETLPFQHYQSIRKLSKNEGRQAYQFVIRAKLKYGELSKYEWLGNFGKYSRDDVAESGYIPTLEIRFFKKSAFQEVLAVDNEVLQLAFYEGTNTAFVNHIQFKFEEGFMPSHSKPGEDEQWRQDRGQFSKKDEGISEQTRSFELFGPGNIGYSLISELDIPSLEAGLELGFGQIEILKWALHNLIEKGAYRMAIRFAEKILDRLPESSEMFEIWHLKGIASFYELDLANAEQALQKALELNGTDINTLSDLARVHIVSGKVSEARMVLEKVHSQYGLTPENEYIYNILKQDKDRQAKISLLILCRDEEMYIGRALKSARALFDEIVAVDTGSKDKTLDILREYGAKIVSHTWNDDFAEARNYGLAQVTGDYVFWMDADEYLDNKDRLSFFVFKDLLPLKEKTGVVFDIQTLNGDYDLNIKEIPPTSIIKRTALFPNFPEIRFSGKVFECVDPSLEALSIPLLFAENISIKHHSKNDKFRGRRKTAAMAKSANDFGVEKLFQGIHFWLELGEVRQALQWFEHAIVKADGHLRYLNTICKLFDEFSRNELIQSHPHIFRQLVSNYDTSYRVATLCADYLYDLKEYDGAINQLRRLVYGGSNQFTDEPAWKDIQKNRLHFAMASLEQDDLESCNAMLALLSGDDGMADAVRALSFYKAIRIKELDSAITVLDKWIRERNIPIKGTIGNFTDFISLVGDFAEVITKYGLIDAAGILIRAADYFAATLTKEI